jgi:hypothetical protein
VESYRAKSAAAMGNFHIVSIKECNQKQFTFLTDKDLEFSTRNRNTNA